VRRSIPAASLAAAAILAALAAPAAASPDEAATTPTAERGSELAAKSSLSRGELRSRLRRALSSAGGASGAYVYDIDARGNRVLFSANGGDSRIPASNEKLFTTAALLNRYGPDTRLDTSVYARGERRGAGDQILHGDLVVVGAGDPALGTPSFARNHDLPLTPLRRLARNIEQAGLKRISGDILADDTIFDRRRGVGATGWAPSIDLSPLSGLSFNSGVSDGHFAKNPEIHAVRALRSLLRKHGVSVGGGVGRADLKRSRLRHRPLALVRSPRIKSLIAETNTPSNNFFAEMLLKRLVANPDRRGTTSGGANRAQSFADSVGSGVHAVDGSGLSRSNRVSPRNVVRLLAAMRRHGMHGGSFLESLPVAGREGTVRDRMNGTAAAGNCHTKTGTLSDVSALSGYCRAGRHLIAFSILMNSLGSIDAARRAQDAMAAAVARYNP
jgi:D-alanyl-D-alanine carboxypeptidase/D-alanyl-D-alanine-endopeptidase (penicillin-binding protein 4)